jgi:hypothetical protein
MQNIMHAEFFSAHQSPFALQQKAEVTSGKAILVPFPIFRLGMPSSLLERFLESSCPSKFWEVTMGLGDRQNER